MAHLDRLTLAVVDDDADVRTALHRLLRSMGHDVRLFASAEAFEADDADVDCLILDVRLPGLSGVELRERLRTRGAALPVVFITGEAEPFQADDSRALEAPSLTKPFMDDELTLAIARAVSGSRHAPLP